jgi:hypothetical protein
MAHIDHLASPLIAAVAQEIRDVRALLEGIADILIADPDLAATYVAELQGFDLAIQRSDENANLLDRMVGGARPVDAVNAVRLDAVQSRLHAALTGVEPPHGG